jgi:phospholipase C
MPGNQLASIDHIVVLMLENRSFDHMLGLLYSAEGNISPASQPHEGPSHLQKVHAELVAQLPVSDGNGGTHHTMPDLQTNEDYQAYIRERTEAWLASRRPA